MKSEALTPTIFFIVLIFCGCERERTVMRTRMQMSTVVEITAGGPDEAKLLEAVNAAFAEISRVEAVMSDYREGSEVWKINHAAGKEPVEVSKELYDLLQRAVEVSRMTGGAFDITFAGLSGLWDFSTTSTQHDIPAEEEINKRRPLIGYEKMVLDPQTRKVFLPIAGMRIGLGAIAKGYAVDRAIAVLRENGVQNALVNAGGDLRAIGLNHGKPWIVGLQDPRNKGNLLYKIEITNKAIATSGDYEKFFIKDGKRYCHILDPHTGWPAQGTRSVTIVANTALEAQPFGTSLFVLGPEKGMKLIESLKDVQAIIIDAGGKEIRSSGLEKSVTLHKVSLPYNL